MTLTNFALIALSALALAGCSTSQAVNAKKTPLANSARAIVGTSLIGAKGATASDQNKIDETAAGLCGAGVWRPSECARHKE